MSDYNELIIPELNLNVPKAGNIINCKPAWEELTRDSWVLDCVSGLTIPFISIPVQIWVPRPFKMTDQEKVFVDNEIN